MTATVTGAAAEHLPLHDLRADSAALLAAPQLRAVAEERTLSPPSLGPDREPTNYHPPMAQWEHRGCGTIREAGPIPPRECDVCSVRGVRPDLEPGWTRVGTVPRTQKRRPRRTTISASKRSRVYERDGHRCVECRARENLTLDHRVPIAKGGGNEESNLQTMCERCNLSKSDFATVPGSVAVVRDASGS
jgi:hypothetical protein